MRILIVDDHPLYRAGLMQLVQNMEIAREILEADSIATAQRALDADSRFDLIMLDQELPDGTGISWLKQLRKQHPALKVLMISAWTDVVLMRDAMRLGVVGYIPKTTNIAVIYAAIKLVLAGGQYFPPELIEQSKHSEQTRDDGGLTIRQQQVLRLIQRGLSNKEIARTLGISESTVKAHVTSILRHEGVSSRARLISHLNTRDDDT